MGYEYNKSDVVDMARTLRHDTHTKGSELFFSVCPYCQGGQHKDKDSFSINLDNGTFKCFRSSCGKQGHFVEMARDFNYKLDFGNEIKQYRKLPQKPITIRTPAIQFLNSRGISQDVGEQYKITTVNGKDNVIVFPFHDEQGILKFVKYRNAKHEKGKGSKEWAEKDTEPILFGMAQCEGFDKLVITEGQIDSLSLAEAGIKNAVSVPTGARGFTWITNVWDWIVKFKEIIIFGDNEGNKITLLDELQKRLPNKIKAVKIEDYLGEKDANDILRKYGKKAIIEAVSNAEIPPVKAVKRLSDVESVDLYNLPKIKTGIREIDRLIGGLYLGQIAILTGKRGEGKSTFMSQLICEALEQDYNTFIYTGELSDYHFKHWVDLQLAGSKNIQVNKNKYGDDMYSLHTETTNNINNWYRDKAFIYDNNYIGDDELNTLTSTIEKAIKQYDLKLICIDNLMTAIDVEVDSDLYKAQSKFVKDLKTIANRYNVMIILVAHPRKSKDGFTNDDVSGSSDITNRVDLVFNYARNKDENKDCDGILNITKNRLTGKLTDKDGIQLFYSNATKRITSLSSEHKRYGWETQNDKKDDDLSDLPF